MSDTFRTDTAAALVVILDAFTAANPTMLRRTFSVRPESFATDLPCAYLGPRPEAISHTMGTRERVMNPSIVVVGTAQLNAASMAAFDALVDAMADHLSTYAHVVPNTIWDRMTVEDDREEIGDGTSLPSVRFTYQNLSKRVGRTALT